MKREMISPAKVEHQHRPGTGWVVAVLVSSCLLGQSARAGGPSEATKVDFNRDIRPILSDKCLLCHGPDPKNRKGSSKGGLRLDTQEGAFADLGGMAAVVAGKPDESEMLHRVVAEDPSEVMPPPETGKRLTPKEVDLLKAWISQGAPYAKHWAYQPPVRHPLPEVKDQKWSRRGIDRFILARLEAEVLKPAPEADRYALIRRLTLDLTGLPPTIEEADRFAKDSSPDAYEKLVDRLLDRSSYGEHWARMWLDLARYADSAGYADDPARTIWAYRDYVVRALNSNKPFDQFTIEQIAGDLLPNPTEEQLIATAFHRNTLTNNEGGTNDEEFRTVAVVDRVNTTMAVWMGTTIACAQCHDHKYDPLSQKDYFRFYAFFNNTEDADRGDESPLLSLFTPEQKARKATISGEIAKVEEAIGKPSPSVLAGQPKWEAGFGAEPAWKPLKPASARSKAGAKLSIAPADSIRAEAKEKTDTYTVELPLDGSKPLTALRLEALTDDALPAKGPGHSNGNFVVSRIRATLRPKGDRPTAGRYVRIEVPGKEKILSLAEVQVYREGANVAPKGEAKQSSTGFDGPAPLAIDGKTDGRFVEAKSTTHTAISDDPWWEVDLKSSGPIDRVVIWNRTDEGTAERLKDFRVTVLDEARKVVSEQKVAKAPKPSVELSLRPGVEIAFAHASADVEQSMFEAASLLDPKAGNKKGWAIGGGIGKPHALTLVPKAPVAVEPGATLSVSIDQLSEHQGHTLGRFRLAASEDPRAAEVARTPAGLIAILKTPADKRTDAQKAELTKHYLAEVAPELAEARAKLAGLKADLDAIKPSTTVPIFREMASTARRKTNIQNRGNFLDLGPEVTEGVPATFPPLPKDAPADRLSLAKWLVSPENPLTARVIVNRYWEQIFGTGLVATAEEFGTQGDQPSHPELLDWLATELVAQKWDMKALLKELVLSSTYRQDSKVSPDLVLRDPDNRLLARGPRFRMSAEAIRDQALAVGGLLSKKQAGPPVKPPQPSTGLSAAFGAVIDWETSKGEDKYRRALYTTWRRSNPYPSMATFDAPNREVCTVRRTRTNTPLQALVTLNDPVYIEAAQALARRMAAEGGSTPEEKARLGFRLCLLRQPEDRELARLVKLYESVRASFAGDKEKAVKMATEPLGPLPAGADAADLAAWSVVGNVLLNLDETVMKR